MNERSSSTPLAVSISAVERDTGLSKDTLRVWERRYGFPRPSRDAYGERLYPVEQVERLRVIRRLMDAGHRPGKIIQLAPEALQALTESTAERSQSTAAVRPIDQDHRALLDLVKTHRVDDLRRELSQSLMRLGLERFVIEVVASLNEHVGDAWTRGLFEIFEEHLYTESMQVVLRHAINTIPRSDQRPRILLTTFPQEQHGLGLLMAEALLALNGCRCISLGVQTPVWDIARAAAAQHADIVALSFSASLNHNGVLDGLNELRATLPSTIDIWAGGSCSALHRKPLDNIRVFAHLRDVRAAVDAWRESHAKQARGA